MAINANFRRPEDDEEQKKPRFSFADFFKQARQTTNDYQNSWQAYIRAAFETNNKIRSPYTVNSTPDLSDPSMYAIQGMRRNAAQYPVLGDYADLLDYVRQQWASQRPMDVSKARKLGADISALDGTDAVGRTTRAQTQWDRDARASGLYDSEENLNEQGVTLMSDKYIQEWLDKLAKEREGRQMATADELQYMRDTFGIQDDAEAQRLWNLAVYNTPAFTEEINKNNWYTGIEMKDYVSNIIGMYDRNNPAVDKPAADLNKARTSLLEGEQQRRAQEGLFAEAMEDPDFAVRSQYIDTYNGNYDERFRLRYNFFGAMPDAYREDDVYHYINNPEFRARYDNQALNTGAGNPQIGGNSSDLGMQGYAWLDDDQRKYFNSLWNDEGNPAAHEEAMAFLKSIEPSLLARRAKNQEEVLREVSNDPYGAVVTYTMAAGANVMAGFMAPGQIVAAITGYDDPNSPLHDVNRSVQVPRQTIGENIYEWGKSWGGELAGEASQFAYNGVTALLDVVLARQMGGASRGASNPKLAGNIVQGIMSSQAANNTLYNEMQSGTSTEGAVTKAILAGAVEAFTEKYSIDAFMKNPGTGIKYFLQNMLTEGAEEGTATLLNTGVDEIVSALTGDTSALTDLYNQGLMSGLTSEAAAMRALGEFAKNLGTDIAMGGMVGGLGATPGAIGIYAENTQTGQRVQENDYTDRLMQLAETMPEDSESRKLWESYTREKPPKAVTKLEGEQTPAAEAPTETAQNAPKEAVADEMAKDTQTTVAAPESKTEPARKGKKLSTAKIGRLYRTLYSDLDAQGKQTVAGVMESSVKERLTELGEDPASTSEVAAPLAKLLADGTLTNREKQVIARSKNALRVFNEIRFAEDDADSSDWVGDAGKAAAEATADNTDTRAELTSMLAPKVGKRVVEDAQRTATETGMTVEHAKHGTDAKLGVQLTGKDGQTQEAEILQVTGVTKAGMKVKVKGSDGQTKTVDMADMKFANSDTATIAAYIKKAPHVFTAEEANKMMQTYMGGDVQEHISGFTTLYNAGYAGRAIPPSKLPQAQVIYDLGKQDAATDEANRLKGIGTGKRGTGKVTFAPGVQRAGLNKVQRDSEYLLRVFAKAHGMDFVLYESAADADGYYRAANGRYQNNTLYIDMNSGKNSTTDTTEYAILRTAAHEITHYIEHNSAEGYARLKDYVKSEYARKGKSWDNLVEAKLATRTMNSRLTRAGAEAEVMADAMEMMLQDSKAIERLQKRDQSLYEKIKRFIVDYFRKVREAFANVGAAHDEAKWLMEEGSDGVMHYAEKMVQLWDEALVEAAETVQGSAAEEAGIEIDTATESAYAQNSVRTWNTSQYVQNRDKAAKQLADSLKVTVAEAKKWIDDVNSIAATVLQDKVRLDYFPSEFATAFKSNPEYGGSIDMSTICAKRRLATGTLDAIQNKLGDVALTKDDFLRIREMMKERGHEVACGLCFVESSRKNLSKYTKQFVDIFNVSHPDAKVTMTDFNTVDGLETMRSQRPDAYAEYEKFMNRLAQRKPKLFEKRTEYRHEILDKFTKDSSVGAKNRAGGLRLQSFSDFEIVHLIDMMQVITDMSSVGLAGQAYTKVPDFAWALGNTGLKINLSLIAKGVDENGNLVFDDVEGMNHNEAKKLRDAYSKNVGTIVVTFTDEQLIAAMKDDFVDFIIPFHRSQWQKSDYAVLGLPEGTKDYTLHQNEKQGRKRVKENYAPNAYWDFNLTGKQNAQKYLDMCAADGRTPKFAKFLQNNGDGTYSMKEDGSTDGYWKLLIDFKMYDNDGNGSPQLPVRPEFNMDEANRMLNDYKGGHETYPVAQDVVDDFVREYTGEKLSARTAEAEEFSDANVQYSIREEDPPKKTGIAYKVFFQKNGKLYPPMVANPGGADTPVGVWLNADVGVSAPPSKTGRLQVKAGGKGTQGGSGSLAFRPGWHLGDIPKATQFDRKNPATGAKELFPYDFVWAECEYAMDVDYQEEAMSYGYTENGKFRHSYAGLPRLPVDGYYHYRTNPDPKTVPWVITGAMKVNRILSRAEVDAILEKEGVEPTKWQGPDGQQMEAGDVQYSPRDTSSLLNAAEYKRLQDNWNDYKLRGYKFVERANGGIVVDFDYMLVYTDNNGNPERLLIVPQEPRELNNDIIKKAQEMEERGLNYGAQRRTLGGLFPKGSFNFIVPGNGNKNGRSGKRLGSVQNRDGVRKNNREDMPAEKTSSAFEITDDSQESRREIPNQINMWDYMDEMEAEAAQTGEEAAALNNYKRVMGDLRQAIADRNKYREALKNAATPTERGKALNSLQVATKRLDRAYDQLSTVMKTPAMKAIEQRSTAFVQEYLDGKTLQDVAELIDAEEAEIKRLAGKNEKEAQKHREIVRQLRSKATENLLKEREKFHNMMDRDRRVRDMNMKAAQHRKHLAAQVKKLDGLIRHETDYKHVPEELKPLVEAFVGAFTEKGAGIVFDKKQADKLSRVYRKLLQTDGSMNQLGYLYDEDVMPRLDELNNLLEEELAVRSGKGMTMEKRAANRLATMEDLADIADSVYGMVKNANELFYGGKKAQFAAIGTEAMQAMEQRKDYRRLKGKAGENVEAADNFMRAGNMTPVYFFDRLKNKVFKTLYGDMLAAQDEYAFRVAEARKFWQETKEKYHYDSWADDAALTMKTEKGKQLTLDKEDAMSVYATWKREHADELLPSYHLEDGGIVLEGNQMQDGDKKYLVAVRTTPTTLTQNDMAQIHAYLTEEQKAYADAVVEYMSTTMADYGNETSMELYGIKKYKESYYFPMKSAGDQLYQKSTAGVGQVTDDNRVKHRSFTKTRVRGAATPVVIGKFSQVAATHMEQMILYSTMTMPIESMNRVLNYKHQFEDGSKTTVRALMEQKYGPVMKRYMETFLSDMNGGIRRDSREAGLNKLVSLFKRGSVLASASVVVQQPTAIARATAMISPKYLMATTVPHKGDYDQLKKHSGVAILKDMGKFDVDMGAATAEWMLDADEGSYSMWQKLRQATNIKDFEAFKKRWNTIFTWAPGKADQMTWAWLWRAVKAEQAELNPGMSTGSDAFLDMCGERFNDIVNHTQVYDSTLVRSQNMRSKSGMMQMLTSFMSEPTLTANMLYDAVSNKERGKKYAVRAVTAALVSQILTSLAQALVSAGRDEDEKKTWAEKYAGKAAGNLASNLNPMNMLPLLRDIQSLMDGYDVTRADMSIFTEITKAFGKLDNDNLTPYRKAEELVGSLAKLVGIPAKNIMRDLRSFMTTFLGNADRPTMGYAVGEAVKAELLPGYDTKADAYYQRLYNAMAKGDQKEAETIREYLVTVLGKKETSVRTGIQTALKQNVLEGDVGKDEAIKWLMDNGLKNKQSEAFKTVDEWIDKAAHADEEGYSHSMYGDFLDNIPTGGKAMVNAAKELLANGVDKKTIAKQIAERYKEQLIELHKKGNAATLLARLLSAYEAIGYDREYELKYIKKNWLGIK